MKNDCGTKLQQLTEKYGFTKQSQLADSIVNLIASRNLPKSSFDIQGDKKRVQSELSKIFTGKKNPGLEILLEMIEALANQNHTYSRFVIANEIIEIYQNQLNARYVSLILNQYDIQNEESENVIDLLKLSHIDREWFNEKFFLTQDCGGLDWNDSHRKHPELDDSMTDILKLLSDCIRHDDFQNFKKIYQNIANFLQLYGYRPERLLFSNQLDLAAQRLGDIETSIQARASHTWSLVTDRKLDLAKKMLSKLLEDFDTLNLYDEKTNFSKIISFENLARIAIIESNFDLAKDWLNEQLGEIQISKKLNVSLRLRTRYAIPVDYHLGRISFNKNDYHSSLQYFEKAQQDAMKIGWTRMEVCAQNWIAKIYIFQDQLILAETLLKEGLEVTEKISSKGRLGFYHQDLAILYKKRQEKETTSLENKYMSHYHQACSIFIDLGMDNALKNLRKFIE